MQMCASKLALLSTPPAQAQPAMSDKQAPTRSSKENVSGSQSNLAASKSNLLGSKSNLLGSKANLAGSRGNLAGSRNNLAGSRGNLAQRGPAGGGASDNSGGPANAVVYENTYKLKPDKKFQTLAVRRIIEEVLAARLTKVKYDHDKVPDLIKTIADEILAAVKKLEFERYKIVVDINIGEFKGQGIKVASRAVWDTTTDSYASASFKNASLFAVAMVFGCYYE